MTGSLDFFHTFVHFLLSACIVIASHLCRILFLPNYFAVIPSSWLPIFFRWQYNSIQEQFPAPSIVLRNICCWEYRRQTTFVHRVTYGLADAWHTKWKKQCIMGIQLTIKRQAHRVFIQGNTLWLEMMPSLPGYTLCFGFNLQHKRSV